MKIKETTKERLQSLFAGTLLVGMLFAVALTHCMAA